MSHYYFHLHDGQDLPDHEGRDLPDLKAAQAYAAEIVFLQLKEDAGSSLMTQAWSLDVKDEEQRTLFTLRFKSMHLN